MGRIGRGPSGPLDTRPESPDVPDLPCAVCGLDPGGSCQCRECNLCHAVGDPKCYKEHGLRLESSDRYHVDEPPHHFAMPLIEASAVACINCLKRVFEPWPPGDDDAVYCPHCGTTGTLIQGSERWWVRWNLQKKPPGDGKGHEPTDVPGRSHTRYHWRFVEDDGTAEQ